MIEVGDAHVVEATDANCSARGRASTGLVCAVSFAGMDGYDHQSYGEAFADVYDEWYHDVSDVAATVAGLLAFVDVGGRILELGVGTGRLAVPLAEAGAAIGVTVVGVDSSPSMLAGLAKRDPSRARCGGAAATWSMMRQTGRSTWRSWRTTPCSISPPTGSTPSVSRRWRSDLLPVADSWWKRSCPTSRRGRATT